MIFNDKFRCLLIFSYTISSIIYNPSYSFAGMRYNHPSTKTTISMTYGRGRSSSFPSRGKSSEKSKRQERVGHLVRSEIATIIHQGYSIKSEDIIEDELRQKISVVDVNMSPDLRQARITISVIGKETIEKRRAYSWLVKSSKQIKHALAQRTSHMKSCPNLTFVHADVGSAVDVMNLIDKISKEGYKRESIDLFDGYDDDDDWIDDFDDDEDEDDYIDDDDDDISMEKGDNINSISNL